MSTERRKKIGRNAERRVIRECVEFRIATPRSASAADGNERHHLDAAGNHAVGLPGHHARCCGIRGIETRRTKATDDRAGNSLIKSGTKQRGARNVRSL